MRVGLRQWSCGWQHRGRVTARMLYLMFVRMAGWIVLLACSSPPKYVELSALRHELATVRPWVSVQAWVSPWTAPGPR